MKKQQFFNNEKGFSIMEMMVVMVLTLIILVAVFSLMRGTITTANANFEMSSATQGMRNSQEYLTRDILIAGDGLKGIANIWLPTAFVTGNLTVRAASAIDPTGLGYVNVGVVISDNNVPAGTPVRYVTPSATVLPLSDRLSMLARDTSFSAIDVAAADVNVNNGEFQIPAARIGDFTAGEIYFISNGVAGVFGTVTNVNSGGGKIRLSNGDAYSLNRTGSTGPVASVSNNGTSAVTIQRVRIIQYFVDNQFHLVRRVFGVKGSGYIDSVVAEHVKTLDFRYVLRPSDASTILGQPALQIDIADAANVRTIEPSLTVETAYPLQDGDFHQVEGTILVSVRNIQFNNALTPRDADGGTALPNPGPTPVITPTPVMSATPTPLPTATPTPTPTPSATPTPSPAPTVSPTP